ncbi:hypothetical protein ScPMuIL_011550 [Solemya velum]
MTTDVSGPGSGSRHPVKIFANIFISFIGAGVLGLPYAFSEAGILEGIVIMAGVGIISVKAMMLIIDCKYKLLQLTGRLDSNSSPSRPKNTLSTKGHKNLAGRTDEDGLILTSNEEQIDFLNGDEITFTHENHGVRKTLSSDITYGDVGYYAMGHTGRLMVDLAIVVSQTGFCCAYLIFISENLSDYIPKMSTKYWLLILLPPLSLLTQLRQLGSLALTSVMAQCSNLMAFAVVFWFDFEHFSTINLHPKEMSLEGMPFFLAISIYCYEGAGMILSLESSVVEDLRSQFKKIFIITMTIVTTLYITFGTSGYLSFGTETNPIITLNLPKGDSVDFSMIVKSCLCLALFFTYPVMMFPVMHILEGYLIKEPKVHKWKGNILRVVMVLSTGIVVLLIPNFTNLMALVGSSCCTLLAFILPGLFHLSIFRGSLSLKQITSDWFLVFIGIVGTLVGLIDALKRLNGDENELMAVPYTSTSSFSNVTSTVSTNVSHVFTSNHSQILHNTSNSSSVMKNVISQLLTSNVSNEQLQN